MSKQKKWENIIRSKLENFEAETHPDDWNAILDRLPGSKRIRLFQTLRYAAAVLTGLLILSGGYFFLNQKEVKPLIVHVTETEKIIDTNKVSPDSEDDNIQPSIQKNTTEELPEQNERNLEESTPKKQVIIKTQDKKLENIFIAKELKSNKIILHIHQQNNDDLFALNIEEFNSQAVLMADITPIEKRKKTLGKRWGVGMGGGSYSVGTDGGVIPEFLYPTNLLTFNSEAFKSSANVENKQNVSHKRPVSFGVGVGYALNERWSLQSGLYYTMLKSEWWFVNDYHGVSKQKLHFLGIPLGISYKIAEWKRFQLYASAGGMTEWNMAGTIKTNFYTDNQLNNKVTTKEESIRMKQWQWSVNGKVGVSYPIFKFMNAFVEGGANYYFDTGSSIETIRTDKPFHVSLQAGIRLGF